MRLRTSTLGNKLEPFIVKRIQTEQVDKVEINSDQLLTCNRFDLGLKLAYLSLKDLSPSLAIDIYKHDIRSQTLGKFKEYGNEEKSSFQAYIDHFHNTFRDIEKRGFDENKTLIPLSENGSILNGAHRVASAIFLDKTVVCIKTEISGISVDYRYFLERDVPREILDIGAISFGDYAKDVYLAFLWPSGRENCKVSESLIPNVVYKKNVKLNANGGFNLLIELYKHMSWVGSVRNGYLGAYQKLKECFTDFNEFSVILFQCDSLEKVQSLKKQIREVNKIGFSSVHITDTKEEVKRISRLLFNQNGLHFLNYARPNRFTSSIQMLKNLQLLGDRILEKFVLAPSMTLSIYGLREAKTIEIYSEKSKENYRPNVELLENVSQLDFNKVEIQQLIFNPKYFFEFQGVKFISFNQAFLLKKNRNEIMDQNDCEMMNSLIDKGHSQFSFTSLKQKFFYRKLVIESFLREFIVRFLKLVGAFNIMKMIYLKIKRLE